MQMKHNSWTRNWSVYFRITTRPPNTIALAMQKDSNPNQDFQDFSMEISFNISINVFEIFR